MNARQTRFVEAYLIDPCGTHEAIRAGYSQKTADRIGSKLLRNVEVAAAIEKAQAERGARAELTADMVVRELKKHAFGDTRDYIAIRALDLLGRHLGMFKDKVNIGADVSLLDALRRIEAREDEEAIRGAK